MTRSTYGAGGSTYSIDPDTNISSIRRNIGSSARARKRESERRRRRLEKLANWVGDPKAKVKFVEEGAKCKPASDRAPHDVEVYVPTAEHEQPETDLDPAVWDFVFQKAELIHELLHVIYTDFEAMEQHVDRIGDMHRQRIFQRLFNIGEDGAIERQGAEEFNIGNDLHIKNKNLMVKDEPGEEKALLGDTHQEIGFIGAVELFLLDKAKYDTGRAAQLVNPEDDEYQFAEPEQREAFVELIPRLFRYREDMLTEPNGTKRVELAYELYEDIIEDLEEHSDITDEDALMQLMQNFPNDGEVYVVLPGDPPDDADKIEPDEDDTVIFLEPPEVEEGEGEDPGEKYGEQVENDADEDDEMVEGVKQWKQAVDGLDSELDVLTSATIHEDNWAKAERYGRSYEKQLRRMLQRERESKLKHGQRAGRIDLQSLWKLGYGEGRVFENEVEPEDKDYSVVILLDRSGSMGGGVGDDWIVDEAEAVASGLSMALESVGAEVSVLGVGGDVMLEKPFTESTEAAKEKLCRNHSDGGTPLGKALELSREMLSQRTGKSLVFSITDGYPSDEKLYEEELGKVTFPVVGAYFGPDVPDIDDVRDYYHRIVTCDKDGLSAQVESLIERMVV